METQKKNDPEIKTDPGPYPITTDPDFDLFPGNTEAVRLHLACGKNNLPGCVGVGLHGQAEIQTDLETYPWVILNQESIPSSLVDIVDLNGLGRGEPIIKKNSVYEIYCHQFVQYIKDLTGFMNECYRVLKDQSMLHITAPYYTSIQAVQDPRTVRLICDYTFHYYDHAWLKTYNQRSFHPFINFCNFKVEHVRHHLNPDYVDRGDEARKWALRHNWNVVDGIEFYLRAIKRHDEDGDEG